MRVISRDVKRFADARQRFMHDGDNLGAAFFFFSPLKVVPALWLGEAQIVEVGSGFAILDNDRTCRVIPTGSPEEYYKTIVAAVAKYGNAHQVPMWAVQPFKHSYRVASQQVEYVIPTIHTKTLPGRHNHRLRTEMHKASRLTTSAYVFSNPIERDNAFRAVNAAWYRQAADRHFRTYDKARIEALIDRWDELTDTFPDAKLIGLTRLDNHRLVSFHMGCALTNLTWTAYTRRYDTTPPEIKAVGTLGHAKLAERFSQLLENNGTAANTAIKNVKKRQAQNTITVFSINSKHA